MTSFVLSTLELLSNLDEKSAHYFRDLKEILMKTSEEGDSAIYLSSNNGYFEQLSELLFFAKKSENILSDVLNQKSHWGDDPFISTIDHGRHECAKAILDSAKDYPKLLDGLLCPVDQQQPFDFALRNQRSWAVKMILDSVQDHPDLLEKILLRKKAGGAFPVSLTYPDYIGDVIESTKNHPSIRRKLLFSEMRHFYAIGVYGLEYPGMVGSMLEALIDEPDLMHRILHDKPNLGLSVWSLAAFVITFGREKLYPDEAMLPFLSHLVIAGDEKAVKVISSVFPNEGLEKISSAFLSNANQESVLFVPALAKLFNKGEFVLVQNGVEVALEDVELSKSPITVINNGNGDKAILSGDVTYTSKDDSNLPKAKELLHRSIEMADEEQINRVVFNVDARRISHAATVLFTRESREESWRGVVFDPNYKKSPLEYYKEPLVFAEIISDLVGDGVVDLKGLSFRGLVPNYGSFSTYGFCDIISSIVAASLVTNSELELKKVCDTKKITGIIFENDCINYLLPNVLPELNEVLQARFDNIRNRVLPNLATDGNRNPIEISTFTDEPPCYFKGGGVNFEKPKSYHPQTALISRCQSIDNPPHQSNFAKIHEGLGNGFVAGFSNAFFEKALGLSPSEARVAATGLLMSYVANHVDFSNQNLINPLSIMIALGIAAALFESENENSVFGKSLTVLSRASSAIAGLSKSNSILDFVVSAVSYEAGNFLGKKAVEAPLAILKNLSSERVVDRNEIVVQH